MDQPDTLLTLAEISVAIAGFAGIISMLGRGRSTKSTAADALRVQQMLEMALLNALFALAPLPFLASGEAGAATWRVGCGLHLGASVFLTVLGIWRFRTRLPEADPIWISIAISAGAAASALVDAWVLLGFAAAEAFSFYLATLVLSMTSAGLKFIAVCTSLIRSSENRAV